MTAIRVSLHETRDDSYDVIVGRGVLARLPGLLHERCPAHRYAVIADHKVAELHAAALMTALENGGAAAQLFQFPSGEWNKSRQTWQELTDALIAERFGRDSAVLGFGGGVAGDLAGFVAATFLRGVPYVQVPTSLLAMIDSSIGGKTGVDVPAGKNLVGAFHQPRFVLADIALLATLPRTHLAAGAAEAVKHGIIADAGYAGRLRDDAARLLARDLDTLERVVERSVAIKAEVVAQDEREHGSRQILNFGHTVGHAIEARAGYDLLHGEAVAIGMCAEARLAEALGVAPAGLARDVATLLETFGLPVTIPANLASDDLMAAMHNDKKNRRGAVRCALPSRIGTMARSDDGEWTVEVDINTLREVLETCH